MTKQWNKFCKWFRDYPSVGLSLDVSRMEIEDTLFSSMKEKLATAHQSMASLEAGEIANPDEQRMVGHYWLRNHKLAPNKKIQQELSQMKEHIEAFVSKVRSSNVKSGGITTESGKKFKNLLLIGIGGSALGPQLLSEALKTPNDLLKLYYFDNTDPDGFATVLDEIGAELEQTLCVVISKSGGTVETRNGYEEAAAAYKAIGLKFSKHAVAITCKESKLDNLAKTDEWLDQFYLWDWVGGRTSLFSPVGLLPAALQGIDIEQFITGAAEMDEITREAGAEQNPASLLALMWYAAGNGRGEKDMVILPYKDRLMLFSKYLQQLVMESLGKETDLDGATVNQGIAVYGNKGSTDQHAYVQQLRDGVNNFFVTFIEVLADHTSYTTSSSTLEVEAGITSGDYLSGFFQGTRLALHENNRQSVTITIEQLNAHSLGALIALYERTVGLYASLVNINAYHQPGVEAGKKAATRVVALQREVVAALDAQKGNALSAIEISEAVGCPEEVETVYKILEHLVANSHKGVKRQGQRDPQKAHYSMH